MLQSQTSHVIVFDGTCCVKSHVHSHASLLRTKHDQHRFGRHALKLNDVYAQVADKGVEILEIPQENKHGNDIS